MFWLKVAGSAHRGKIQCIEGDRIAMPRDGLPKNSKLEDWVSGVRVDKNTGRALAYAVSRRVGKTRKQLDRIVSARNMIPLAYYLFRFDQVRGQSPVTAAMNQLRDVYEVVNYEIVKAKVGSLFGIQIYRDTDETGPSFGTGSVEYTKDSDGDGTADAEPRINLPKGTFLTELEPGEKAEILESRTPSTETVNFLNLLIDVTLRALDIPPSFLNEAKTNFFGSRSALIHYLLSCDNKIADLKQFQNEYLAWRAGIAVADGELQLPSGKEFDFLKWEFVEGGLPYWNPVQEATGTSMQIAMGLNSPRRAARELGKDFEQMILETAEDMQFAAEHNVPLTFGKNLGFVPEIVLPSGQDAE